MSTSPVLSSVPGAVSRTPNTSINQGGDNFLIGQMINIKVQQRLDEQHYVVVMRGEARKVVSERALPVGETIDAVVVRVTDKLELRQIAAGSTQVAGPAGETGTASPADYSDMRSVASFYKCNFNSKELAMLQAAVNRAPEAEPMALAGLLLNKRGIPMQQELLHALCALQSGTDAALTAATNQPEIGIDVEPTVTVLAQLMRQVLSGSGATLQSETKQEKEQKASSSVEVAAALDSAVQDDAVPVNLSSTFSDNSNDKQQSHPGIMQLLNDVDAEGLGVRYGTLPVLIDGKLVELELMLFQHRPRDTMVEPLRRLVMSIHTSTLGTVQVTAEALNNRLLIQISSESTEQAEALAAYTDEVSDLAKRFGWALDSIGYEVRTQGGRLAQRVVEHGVRQGVVDNVW